MHSKIKLSYQVLHGGVLRSAGEVIEVTENTVEGLVAKGHQLEVEKPKKKQKAKSEEPKTEEG